MSSPAEYALLGLLTAGPRHGYDLLRHFKPEEPLGRVCRLHLSNAYALLKKLERLGLVTSHAEPQDTRPPRVVYTLTPSGREAFDSWVEQPVRKTREIRLEFLVKLYFARQRDAAAARTLIEEQLHHLVQEIARLEHELQRDPGDCYTGLVTRLRLAQTRAVREALEKERED